MTFDIVTLNGFLSQRQFKQLFLAQIIQQTCSEFEFSVWFFFGNCNTIQMLWIDESHFHHEAYFIHLARTHALSGHANYWQSYQQLCDWFDFDGLPAESKKVLQRSTCRSHDCDVNEWCVLVNWHSKCSKSNFLITFFVHAAIKQSYLVDNIYLNSQTI